jgi:hypothetical protein
MLYYIYKGKQTKGEKMQLLKFSDANSKLINLPIKGAIYSFALPAGYTCPFSKDCKSRAVKTKEGKAVIKDCKGIKFRCYAASEEALYPATYKQRRYNLALLRHTPKEGWVDLIEKSLPKRANIIRLHTAGDFFNQDYFNAWVEVAKRNKDILFYAYTKSLPYWVGYKEELPPNLVLTASQGGKKDKLIALHNLRSVKVIMHPSESGGLPIDHNDDYAADPQKRHINFALLVHNIQPKGSIAASAIKTMKQEGVKFSYSKGGN